jgi:hypothetical protein
MVALLKENVGYLAFALTNKDLGTQLDNYLRTIVWSILGDFWRGRATKELLLLTKKVAELQFGQCINSPANFLRLNSPLTKLLVHITTCVCSFMIMKS